MGHADYLDKVNHAEDRSAVPTS